MEGCIEIKGTEFMSLLKSHVKFSNLTSDGNLLGESTDFQISLGTFSAKCKILGSN